MSGLLTRRSLIASIGVGGLAISGCGGAAADNPPRVLASAEGLTMRVQRLITGRKALAREFRADQMSPRFRTNGNTMPRSAAYQTHLASGFRDWRLVVDGLVATPLRLSMDRIREGPRRTQITRHDCVEGWSAIGEWTGIPLADILKTAGVKSDARYIIFHCADDFGGIPYYESIDLIDAFHPQTILAWGMNGAALPIGHGAPLRLRVERQLGYKHAKFVMRVEAADRLDGAGLGKGGYWEDHGDYEWYAGI